MTMLVTFRSKSATEIYMFAEHARMLLDIIGKPFEPPGAPKGVITAEQVPLALQRLKAAVATAKAESTAQSASEDEPGKPLPVSLAQRAFPLIDMLERAAKKGYVVTWGV